MKNNEEAIILSHEEQSSQNNNKNEVMDDSNMSNKKEISKEAIKDSHRKLYLKNKEYVNLKNYNNQKSLNNMNQHHSLSIIFSNPKHLYSLVLRRIKFINNYIQNNFNTLTSSLDISLQNSKANKLLKRFFHSKQILLIIYIFNIQYMISILDKISFLDFLYQNVKSFMFLSIILMYIHYYFFKNKLFIEKDEEIENFIIKRNPKIKKGKCEECDIIKIMRSSHCIFCNRCIKKFHFHSDWFNICIGANNELLYAITLFFTVLYLFISIIIFWYYILFHPDLLNNLNFIITTFAVVGICINIFSGKFLYTFIKECIFTNFTFYEKKNFRRLTYLFTGNNTENIFNPFNKGIKRNLEEMIINMFDINIYDDYMNKNKKNFTENLDDNNNIYNNENDFDDMDSFKLMIKLVEDFEPLITKKGNIYKIVNGKELINWNRFMLYTVFDIINSPFKDSLIQQAKLNLEELKKSKNNFNKINAGNKLTDNKENKNINNDNNIIEKEN